MYKKIGFQNIEHFAQFNQQALKDCNFNACLDH